MGSVKLKVKSASASIDDLELDCDLDWTVLKVKSEISTKYPGHPSPQSQKLVYAGKLLSDDETRLVELLRLDDDCPVYTVHIVCKGQQAGRTASPADSSSRASSQQPQLRRRHQAEEQQGGAGGTQQWQEEAVGAPAAGEAAGGMFNNMQTNADELNLQQMAWMQQMYAQYLTHYMQYMQSAGGLPPTLVMPDNMAVGAQGAEPPQAAWQGVAAAQEGAWQAGAVAQAAAAWQGGVAPPAPQNPPRQPPVVMNAGGGGGAEMEDDEEGVGRNRDLLDWFYVMSRVLVLFSIVYFYSSFARFALVTGLGFIVYLYQVGFFGRRRGRQRDIIRQEVENVRAAGGGGGEEEAVAAEAAQDNTAETNVQPAEPPRENQPNPFAVAANFFTTLITSLIPEQPQVV